MSCEIRIRDLGDLAHAAVIEVLVKPGDTIKAEQSLVTVECDKASMEIPSSHAGVVKELKVKLGDKVSKGSLLLTLEAAEGAAAPAPAPAPAANRPPSAPRTSASRSCWSSATPPWAAFASTWAASRPRRCYMWLP